MSESNPPSFLQVRDDHTAEQSRMRIKGVFGYSQGVLGPDHLQVVENGSPNMSVNVGAGECVVVGTESVIQGSYHCLSDGIVNLEIDAADGSDRHDIVVARVYDSFYSVAEDDKWQLEIVKGTPSGSPSDPTIPDNCLPLARVLVESSAEDISDGEITDLRPYAYAAGAVARVNSTRRPEDTYGPGPSAVPGALISELDTGLVLLHRDSLWTPFGNYFICTSSTRPSNPTEGMLIYETDTNLVLVYNGTGWGVPGGSIVDYKIGDSTTSYGANVNGESITFTAVSGRLYRVSATTHIQKSTGSGRVYHVLRRGSDSVVQDTATINIADQVVASSLEMLITGSGSVTVSVLAGALEGGNARITAAGNFRNILIVEDVGLA